MKKLTIILLSALNFTACEEVIDLNLDTAPQRLVIDASLDWKKGETKVYPVVDISYTTPYFGDGNSPAVSNAEVKIKTASQSYSLTLFDDTMPLTAPILSSLKGGSRYVYTAGIPAALGTEYQIEILLNGQTYTSKAKMREVPEIATSKIVQKENGGILGKEKELRFYFDGISDGTANAYLVLIILNNNTKKARFLSLDDNYVANNKFQFSTMRLGEKLKAGDLLDITLYRIAPDYKEFAKIILQHSNGQSNFALPARAIGNFVNTTSVRDNPLGGFRVAQYSTLQYKVN